MRDFFLRTLRLKFSTWSMGDLDLIQGIFGDSVVTKYEGGHWSEAQILDRLKFEILCLDSHGVQYWPIFLINTNEHVGCCGLRPHDLHNHIWEVGCQLRRSFWSQKLGREAVKAALDYAFEQIGAHAIYAGHHPENVASQAMLRHFDFTHTHHEIYDLTQVLEPCYLLSREKYLASKLAIELDSNQM